MGKPPIVERLLPCPFCGAAAEVEQSIIGGVTVCCEVFDCVAAGPLRDTEAEAIEAWNTRTVQP
jgi:Lar family restriction alleviation protein